MKYALIVAVLCVFGCSPTNNHNPENLHDRQDSASTTLEDLVYVDMFSPDYTTQHPLQCGTGGDFPDGKEMAFRHAQSGETVHVVFPERASSPEDLDGRFALHGHYQGIQKRSEGHFIKNPPEDYRYFVVSSWEQNK